VELVVAALDIWVDVIGKEVVFVDEKKADED
jgi:hypothetical protein